MEATGDMFFWVCRLAPAVSYFILSPILAHFRMGLAQAHNTPLSLAIPPVSPWRRFSYYRQKIWRQLCALHVASRFQFLVVSRASVASSFVSVCLFVYLFRYALVCFALRMSALSSLAQVVSCHAHRRERAHIRTHTLEDQKSAYSHFIHKQFIRPLDDDTTARRAFVLPFQDYSC